MAANVTTVGFTLIGPAVAEYLVSEPASLDPVTLTKMNFDSSAASRVYVAPVCGWPLPSSKVAQLAGGVGPAVAREVVHDIHSRVTVGAGGPAQVPLAVVRTLPTHALPDTEGETEFVGTADTAREPDTAIDVAVPASLRRTSSTVMKLPASAATVVYESGSGVARGAHPVGRTDTVVVTAAGHRSHTNEI